MRATTDVRKTVIKLIVLSPGSETPSDWTLEDIAHQINDGTCLGDWIVEESTLLPTTAVEAECVALRNDGSFFEEDDDE